MANFFLILVQFLANSSTERSSAEEVVLPTSVRTVTDKVYREPSQCAGACSRPLDLSKLIRNESSFPDKFKWKFNRSKFRFR